MLKSQVYEERGAHERLEEASANWWQNMSTKKSDSTKELQPKEPQLEKPTGISQEEMTKKSKATMEALLEAVSKPNWHLRNSTSEDQEDREHWDQRYQASQKALQARAQQSSKPDKPVEKVLHPELQASVDRSDKLMASQTEFYQQAESDRQHRLRLESIAMLDEMAKKKKD
jgi:hypothetical protein